MGMLAFVQLIYIGTVAHPIGLGDDALFLECREDAVYGRNSVVSLCRVLFYVIVYLHRAKGL